MLSSYLRLFKDEVMKINSLESMEKYSKSKNIILFESMEGFRVVANIWRNRERIARALKINEKEIPEMLSKAIKNPMECKKVENPPFLRNIPKNFDLGNIKEISSGVFISENKILFGNFEIIGRQKLYILSAMGKKICIAIGLCPSILLPSISGYSLKIASSLRYLTLKDKVYTYNLNGIEIPGYAEVIMEGIVEGRSLKIKRVYYKKDPLFQIILPEEYNLLKDISKEAEKIQNL